MATTARESTASFRSGLTPFPSSAYGPRSTTAADPTCQEVNLLALPIGEPLISSILRTVQTTLEVHSEKNGATVSLSEGNMAGRELFAVNGVHVLDVVVCLSDREAALELGRHSQQWSTFNLAARREIRIGEPASALKPTYTEAQP
jgi:hypothetical protein